MLRLLNARQQTHSLRFLHGECERRFWEAAPSGPPEHPGGFSRVDVYVAADLSWRHQRWKRHETQGGRLPMLLESVLSPDGVVAEQPIKKFIAGRQARRRSGGGLGQQPPSFAPNRLSEAVVGGKYVRGVSETTGESYSGARMARPWGRANGPWKSRSTRTRAATPRATPAPKSCGQCACGSTTMPVAWTSCRRPDPLPTGVAA